MYFVTSFRDSLNGLCPCVTSSHHPALKRSSPSSHLTMEFFRTLKINTQENVLHNELTLENLEFISTEIFVIGKQNQHEAEIGGLWGEFTLTRNPIRGGLRFALVECPNALAWTITTELPPDPDVIVIHLTINRQQQKDSIIEEIEEFLDDQCVQIQNYFSR